MHAQEVKLRWLNRRGIAIIILSLSAAVPSFGQNAGQKTFASPVEASHALYQAVRSNDEQTMVAILGDDKLIVSTKNDGDDKAERQQFVRKYQEMHRLVHELDGTTVLYLGAENWPFPVPLIAKADEWYFDSDAGKDEILLRTVGDDEASAIKVCRVLASTKAPTTDLTHSVQAIMNSKAVPVGPLHGYYFKRLNGETPSNDGLNYIAYPAEYRVTGVMTFVVTPTNVVYEGDLGLNTASVAPSITNWKPASGWRVVAATLR